MKTTLTIKVVKSVTIEHEYELDTKDLDNVADLRELVLLACNDGLAFYEEIEEREGSNLGGEDEDCDEISFGLEMVDWTPELKAVLDRAGGDEGYKLMRLTGVLMEALSDQTEE